MPPSSVMYHKATYSSFTSFQEKGHSIFPVYIIYGSLPVQSNNRCGFDIFWRNNQKASSLGTPRNGITK